MCRKLDGVLLMPNRATYRWSERVEAFAKELTLTHTDTMVYWEELLTHLVAFEMPAKSKALGESYGPPTLVLFNCENEDN